MFRDDSVSLICPLRTKHTRGQDLIESALMAGFVPIAAGAVIPNVSAQISTFFSLLTTPSSTEPGREPRPRNIPTKTGPSSSALHPPFTPSASAP